MRDQRWYEKDLCPSLTRKLDRISERFENAASAVFRGVTGVMAGIVSYGLILLIVLAALFGLIKFVKWAWHF